MFSWLFPKTKITATKDDMVISSLKLGNYGLYRNEQLGEFETYQNIEAICRVHYLDENGASNSGLFIHMKPVPYVIKAIRKLSLSHQDLIETYITATAELHTYLVNHPTAKVDDDFLKNHLNGATKIPRKTPKETLETLLKEIQS